MYEIAVKDAESPGVLRPELQPQFVLLVMRCLAKERSERPESALELATELKSLMFAAEPAVQVKPDAIR